MTFTGEGRPIPNVQISSLGFDVRSDANGYFHLPKDSGKIVLHFSHPVYFYPSLVVSIPMDDTLRIVMHKYLIHSESVVISASRNEEKRMDSPVSVQTLDDRVFTVSQSLSLAEGLSFSPGLRTENNCQNCGFNQVRINGLGGAYSRILLDGRPIFGPLMGVYGLEFLPTEMMERVEVVRGGGSALYGAGAVAGIVNIVTRQPLFPEFHVNYRQSWTGFSMPESAVSAFGAYVLPDERFGVSGFGVFRARAPFDANGDGFSERTRLTTAAGGAKFFLQPKSGRRLTLDVFSLHENRRGGSDFSLPPHLARTAEALIHTSIGSSLAYEHLSNDLRRRWAVYVAVQYLVRNSYYGNVLMIMDGRDPYGLARDGSYAGGIQYSSRLGPNDWATVVVGTEAHRNDVSDRTGGVLVAGRPRTLRQIADNAGVYALFEPKIGSRFTLQAGVRADVSFLAAHDGIYRFGEKRSFFVVNPRFSAIYKATAWMRVRTGYGMGFRPPLAFDEDLHLAVVAGEVQSRRLAPNLSPELSHSLNAELVFTPKFGRLSMELGIDGFYTRLLNVFAYTVVEPDVWEKRNQNGAHVWGGSVRTFAALGDKIWGEINFTLLRARYDVPVDWGGQNPESRFLRTPELYGSAAFGFNALKTLSVSLTAILTGPMLAPRFSPFDHGDVPDDEPYRHLLPTRTEILRTPVFLDIHPKVAYRFSVFRKLFYLEPYVGVFNIFNAYQLDFGYGVYRDPSYVYGPERPITPYLGLKTGWN
jgi:outer membrane receptor for ferrienterochelin and colicins